MYAFKLVKVSILEKLPTSPGSLKAIKEVDPLNVVGESGVGHQGLVAVYVVNSKLEGQLVRTH